MHWRWWHLPCLTTRTPGSQLVEVPAKATGGT